MTTRKLATATQSLRVVLAWVDDNTPDTQTTQNLPKNRNMKRRLSH